MLKIHNQLDELKKIVTRINLNDIGFNWTRTYLKMSQKRISRMAYYSRSQPSSKHRHHPLGTASLPQARSAILHARPTILQARSTVQKMTILSYNGSISQENVYISF